MTHPDEHSIEMYVLKPETMASEDLRGLEGHFSECAGCRAVERALREFYADFENSAEVDRVLIARVIQRAFSSTRVIRLSYYRPRPQTTTLQSYTGVLAAMTGANSARPGFETVATYASEPDHILLRIRQDAFNRRVKVYYHADDPAKRDGAIVSLPSVPGEIVLDDDGQLEFGIPEAKTSREWAALDALVILPLGMVEVDSPSPGKTLSRSLGIDGTVDYAVTLRNYEGTITVHVQPVGGAVPIHRLVVKGGPGTTVLVDLSDGHGAFPAPPTSDLLLLRLYP